MIRVFALTFALSTATLLGCSNDGAKGDSSSCSKAFDHMTAVSESEFESIAKARPEHAKEIEADAKKNDPKRRSAFMTRCEAGKINVDCILKAPDTMAYMDCLATATE